MNKLDFVPQLSQILHAHPQTQAFCFDMDGTLLNTEHVHVEASWAAINDIKDALPVSLGPKEQFTEQVLGFSDDQVSDEFKMSSVEGLEERFVERRRDHWGEMLHSHQDLYTPEMVTLLEDIKSHGFELGLVTSSTRKQCHELILGSPLEKYFQFFITRDDVDQPKPNPEPYKLAFSKLECLDITKVIVFEDSQVGFDSALAAGMTPIKVTWYN